jgi:NAD(P)-dependent dehydrogenase (short-subunit alcohol dehydrogenase family)
MACQYTKEDKEEMIERIQMRQTGTPQDIASAALYLASDEASSCNWSNPRCWQRQAYAMRGVLFKTQGVSKVKRS